MSTNAPPVLLQKIQSHLYAYMDNVIHWAVEANICGEGGAIFTLNGGSVMRAPNAADISASTHSTPALH